MNFIKKYKWMLSAAFLLFAAIAGFQFHRVNADIPSQQVKVYEKQQKVTSPTDQLVTEVSSYSMKKPSEVSARLSDANGYKVYLVKLKVKNPSDQDKKIPYQEYQLKTNRFANSADYELARNYNDSFYIPAQQTKEYIIPFIVPGGVHASNLRLVLSSEGNVRTEAAL
ncbi:hypothetical protein Q7A53_16980 [Halobacillus rhizosphaerae]|uniref:hypothetical protein n=1 Tax=Halobacillus rhizosphaerae TaxID=3064889 RepID=UPI00398B6C8A